MGDIIEFKARDEVCARIEYMYAPEVDSVHPYAFRIVCENPENGIWLTREEYIDMVKDLVDMIEE